jgi:hypothetical protein
MLLFSCPFSLTAMNPLLVISSSKLMSGINPKSSFGEEEMRGFSWIDS